MSWPKLSIKMLSTNMSNQIIYPVWYLKPPSRPQDLTQGITLESFPMSKLKEFESEGNMFPASWEDTGMSLELFGKTERRKYTNIVC